MFGVIFGNTRLIEIGGVPGMSIRWDKLRIAKSESPINETITSDPSRSKTDVYEKKSKFKSANL